MATLEKLGRDDWAGLLEAPLSVLIVGKTTCEACKIWAAELTAFLESDEEFANVRFGKIDIDTPGLVSFKRANPWVAELTDLPHTSVWVGGEKKKEFYGGGVDRTANRLRRFV